MVSSKDGAIRRFIAAFDLHFGWEYRYENGRRKRTTTHSLEAVAAMMSFAKDFKPDVFILGGDQLDASCVGHWNKGKPRLTEDLRLKEDMDLLDKYVLTPVDAISTKKIWLAGNHERFIEDLLDELPGIEGLCEPHNYLRLAHRGWQSVGLGQIYKLGKLHFIHGDVLKPGKHRARKLVDEYRRNIRCGHFHTFEAATDVTPYDRKDFHTGIVVPAMARCNAAYMKNKVSNHHQGFLYGWVAPDGTFTDHVMTIVNGRFIWNGKIYDGRKKI